MDDLELMLNEMDEQGTTTVNKNVVATKEIEEELAEDAVAEDTISDTQQHNAELMLDHINNSKVKEVTLEMDKIDYSEEFKEVMDITRTYIKDSFEIETQIADLKMELKDLKTSAREEGVRVTDAGRAIKELVRELKETSDEAKSVEDLKQFIKDDATLYSNVVAIS